MDKYKKYQELRRSLEMQGYLIGEYKEINYGLQFDVTGQSNPSKIRVYESKKKGLTVDLSQVKDEEVKYIIAGGTSSNQQTGTTTTKSASKYYKSEEMGTPLIGVDESGKGDYFGPLVVAGVYADEALKKQLIVMGVADSKKLTDSRILQLADNIKKICPYEVLCLNNTTYNRLYSEIKNLNYLLAWGHSKVIQKLWEKTHSQLALSDQFGQEHLIQNQLKKNQVPIEIEQRPKAEENVVVAAASILARARFVEHMKQMEQVCAHTFPKGAGQATLDSAKAFVRVYGKEKLNEVAKLHFKTTDAL